MLSSVVSFCLLLQPFKIPVAGHDLMPLRVKTSARYYSNYTITAKLHRTYVAAHTLINCGSSVAIASRLTGESSSTAGLAYVPF